MKAFKKLGNSRFGQYPDQTNDLYNNLNKLIAQESEKNFLEEETSMNIRVIQPPVPALSELKKKSTPIAHGLT